MMTPLFRRRLLTCLDSQPFYFLVPPSSLVVTVVVSLLSLVVVQGGGYRWMLVAGYGMGIDIDMGIDIVAGFHISSKTILAY